MAHKKNEKNTIRRKGTGTPEWRGPHLWVKVSLPDGTRPRYRLCGNTCDCKSMSEAMIEERCEAVATRIRGEVERELATEAKARAAKLMTVRTFGQLWTSGELYQLHGDINKLKPKRSVRNDVARLNCYVYPIIGDKPVAHVTEEDIKRVLSEAEQKATQRLKRKWRRGAKYQVYQVMRRLFELAIQPGMLRNDSPVKPYMRPGEDDEKLYGFLYPAELLALLKCPQIPIARRVFYALAIYTGLRKGSLYALTWPNVDFQNRTLTSLHSKTNLPQLFEIPDTLVELLERWFEHCGRPEGDVRIVPDINVPEAREARELREDLKLAGITRSVLFGSSGSGSTWADKVQPLRFHDLRATFVTWALRAGRGDGWITDRTGHLTKQMVERYSRGARLLGDLKYTPFPALRGAIPELRPDRDNVRDIASARRTKRHD